MRESRRKKDARRTVASESNEKEQDRSRRMTENMLRKTMWNDRENIKRMRKNAIRKQGHKKGQEDETLVEVKEK